HRMPSGRAPFYAAPSFACAPSDFRRLLKSWEPPEVSFSPTTSQPPLVWSFPVRPRLPPSVRPHLLLTPRRDIQFPSPYREASVTKISQCMPLNDGIIETITTRGRARSPHEATARSCPATRATGGPE